MDTRLQISIMFLKRYVSRQRLFLTGMLLYLAIPLPAQKSTRTIDRSSMKKHFPQLLYIPQKTFTSLSHTGSDSMSNYLPRNSSVKGFYISQAEVTNREYREFVYYVRDSIAHRLLEHFREGGHAIDWRQAIDWKDPRLDPIMVPMEESFFGRREINPTQLLYQVDFEGNKETIPVYPDTLVWITDFTFSYNEPLVKKYFSHSEYDHYPVVGVTLRQAMAFCDWKTMQARQKLKDQFGEVFELELRLPTNTEWESAAFEEKDDVDIDPSLKRFNSNFGSIIDERGMTIKQNKDDGYFYTSPVKTFPAGPYNLYDMKGNVSEWTLTTRAEILNHDVKTERMKDVYIVKGGGWNSTPYYMQAGVCQFYRATEAHSFIGFRYILAITKTN
jgi:formylglycine-generating enzyme